MPGVEDWKAVLLREVGAGLDGMPDDALSAVLDKVSPYIDVYWEMNSRYAVVYPGLQYLYTKKQCLEILMGQVRDLTQINIGALGVSQQQLLDNLGKLYGNVVNSIKDAEEKARGSRAPAIGSINNPVVMDPRGRIYRTDERWAPLPQRPPSPWNS
jgi:hypothetical protein